MLGSLRSALYGISSCNYGTLSLHIRRPAQKALLIPVWNDAGCEFEDQEDEMQKYPMTTIGHKALETELKQLKSVERPYIINAISVARDHGDLKENAEYHAAKEKQGFIEGRIQELESKLSLAMVIDPSCLNGNTVKFGATVTIVNEDTDEESTYQIVGEDEANIKDGKISITAPIARGMVGKEEGDVFEINAPGGTKTFEILGIAYK